MTRTAVRPSARPRYRGRLQRPGARLLGSLRTTDPKQIAVLYLVTSFAFFLAGGAMALLMRGELAWPGLQFLSTEQYNQLFTMHGTIMLLLYATPILFGFANYIVPLQIGSPDVAFPRLNAFSYWLFLFGGLIVMSGFLTPGGAAGFGWFAYTPLSEATHSPGVGGDLWAMGLVVAGVGTILGAVNFITTIVCLRAPGMTMFRMPIFTWNIFVTGILVLIAFPVLTAALLGLEMDRHLGAHVFDPASGGAILWQHLFWFFGHPEVYIVGVAVLRHRHRCVPGVLTQTAVRLQGHGLRDDLHRSALGRGVGAPHVRDGRGAAGVLLPDIPPTGPTPAGAEQRPPRSCSRGTPPHLRARRTMSQRAQGFTQRLRCRTMGTSALTEGSTGGGDGRAAEHNAARRAEDASRSPAQEPRSTQVALPQVSAAIVASRESSARGGRLMTDQVAHRRDGVRSLGSELAERLPAILDEVGDVLADQHPEYAGFLRGELDEIVAVGTGFVRRLVEAAESGQSASADICSDELEQALFEEIGRVHHRQGRDVIPLLAAYRAGARVAWRHLARAALDLKVSAELFAALAAAVFAAVDQLSEASLRGYVLEQSVAASTREASRAELAELLLSDRSGSAVIRAAAARAGWPLPRRAAVAVVHPDDENARMALARLGPSCLQVRRPEGLVAILTDPSGPGRRARLEAVLHGTLAVVGPTVPLERIPASMHLVQLGAALQRRGSPTEGPLFVDEHLDAIIVHRDEGLLATLRHQQLAPLERMSPAARWRLEGTLTSWLRHMGDRREVAKELHVHPQTVRYRLNQLRELFGPKLDDPAARATLMLALAWGCAAGERPRECPPRNGGGDPPRAAPASRGSTARGMS